MTNEPTATVTIKLDGGIDPHRTLGPFAADGYNVAMVNLMAGYYAGLMGVRYYLARAREASSQETAKRTAR